MGVFSIFRKNSNNELEFVPEIKKEEPTLLSNVLFDLSNNNYIDTTNPDTIAKYKSNVYLLRNTHKEMGTAGDLVIIRNDDFLPEDFIWRENSADTNGEFNSLAISYELRRRLAQNKVGTNIQTDFDFEIPGMYDEDKVNTEMRNLNGVGNVFLPVKFRTTKHFTMNTPLGYTGDYNQVKTNRKYTIIDNATGLINSPYTYTISGRDAYLDVTHEGLEISQDAIILISLDYFNEIKENRELMDILCRRRLMVYKGELDVAVNMILTENGILPFRPAIGIPFDAEMNNIVETDLNRICSEHGYEYEKNHGNMFGSGGHFTDLIDTEYNNKNKYLDLLVDFINLNGNLPYEVTEDMLLDGTKARKLVNDIGSDRLLQIINSYNIYMINDINSKRAIYQNSRKDISEDVKELFRNTVKMINDYFKINKEINLDIWNEVYEFYTSSNLDRQIEAAKYILSRLKANERF